MAATGLHQRIRAEVEGIALVDTHEHLISETQRLRSPIDLFEWIFGHYIAGECKGAGMPDVTLAGLRDAHRPLDERWREFAPYWREVCTTGHGRALLLGARELLGVADITDHTYEDLQQRLRAAYRPGWFRHVLKERANIALILLDALETEDPTPLDQIDRGLFTPVVRVNDFVLLSNRRDVEQLECRYGVAINALGDVLKAMDVAFRQIMQVGAAALKVSVAYSRPLLFEKVSRAAAERVFDRLPRADGAQAGAGQPSPLSFADVKPLQDWLMHQAIQRAAEYHLPLQIHTGLLSGGGSHVRNADPLLLTNVLLEYREATFVLLHAGYPFRSELTSIGKYFGNVFVDLCWVHVLSPWVAKQTLHEWIEMISAHKIMAFGGDYRCVEGTYAASRMARQQLTEVLVQKVEDGYLSEEEAIGLARKFLRENALRLFRLDAA